MDKRVVFAVAGAGKTTKIIDALDEHKRVLIVTYTDANLATLRKKIILKFRVLPKNILLLSYFTFLHRFCFLPIALPHLKTKGISFKNAPSRKFRFNSADDEYYIDELGRLYSNRIAKLLETRNALPSIIRRIEKYFDLICCDEVQDFGGYDFDFLINIGKAQVDFLLVGDFYQHTFSTSNDGQKNTNLYDDFDKYKIRLSKAGFHVDTQSLIKSYRCSDTVCRFIREKLGIEIYSHTSHSTEVRLVESEAEADSLYACTETVKLFYQKHDNYNCYSKNWGNCKGEDHYNDVCVALTADTYKLLSSGKNANQIAPITKKKLYVACSRARGNLYFVSEKLLSKFKVT